MRWALAAGAAVAAVGGFHLAVWLGGAMANRGLTSITMKTNCALCLLLLGVALMASGARWRWLVRASQAAAVLALSIGLLTFVENLTNWDLHIDQLLAAEPPGALGVHAPNRMGSPASLSFTFAGAAMLMLRRGGRMNVVLAQSLALCICVMGLLSVVGFLYDADALYGIARVTTIAWPTAVSLLLLGLGLLSVRPHEGIMAQVAANDPGGMLLRRVLVPLALVPLALGWARLAGERLGWFDTAMGGALRTVLIIILLVGLMYYAAVRLSQATTQSHHRAQHLRKSEAQLQATVESLAEGVVVADADGNLIHWNPAALAMFGFASMDECRRHVSYFADIFELTSKSGEILQLDDWPLPRILRGEQLHDVEFSVLRRDSGERRTFNYSGTLVRDPNGRPVLAVVGLNDITKRKLAEEELRAAKQAAEEASRAKDHFLAVLSHELRTPLTPVVTALSMLLRKGGFNPDWKESLEMIRRNVELEARLIDDLLDVTRISRGKVELDKKPIRLSDVMGQAIEVVKPDIEARQLSFSLDNTDGARLVDADATRLQQVFWNLLRNAVKFTPQGGRVEVRVNAIDQAAPNARSGAPASVEVQIIDSGEGIEPTDLCRIFNAFEQAERSITRQFGGLGLGLAISKALVEMHGGTITAHSEGKGRGATFKVTLPLCLPPDCGESPAPTRQQPRPRVLSPRLRILLVEDHGDTARTMQRLLTLDGHDVRHAGEVAAALQMTKEHEFDLIISDLGLPDRSGVDLIRELRQRGKITPAIALSGYGQEEDIRRSKEAGFAAHLTKPTSLAQLEDAIATVI